MKDLKTKFVAVELNDDGTCKRVLFCKNLTEKEYTKLLDEETKSKKYEKEQKEKLSNNLWDIATKFSKHDFLLAKSIYDNFVDRGLIEDDEQFEKEFFQYIFEDKIIEHYPEEYNKIFGKVVGLK